MAPVKAPATAPLPRSFRLLCCAGLRVPRRGLLRSASPAPVS
jgi:hypothetical protein